jgi:hypothetical protein
MGTLGKKGAQPLGGQRNGCRPDDADGIEAVGVRGVDQLGFERCWSQKSRSP